MLPTSLDGVEVATGPFAMNKPMHALKFLGSIRDASTQAPVGIHIVHRAIPRPGGVETFPTAVSRFWTRIGRIGEPGSQFACESIDFASEASAKDIAHAIVLLQGDDTLGLVLKEHLAGKPLPEAGRRFTAVYLPHAAVIAPEPTAPSWIPAEEARVKSLSLIVIEQGLSAHETAATMGAARAVLAEMIGPPPSRLRKASTTVARIPIEA